jgi:hypothetical protein
MKHTQKKRGLRTRDCMLVTGYLEVDSQTSLDIDISAMTPNRWSCERNNLANWGL